MGFLRDWLTGQPTALDALAPSFAVDAEAIPPEFFGLSSYAPTTSLAPRIDYRSAIQVPAVKRCRDLIAGTLGALPIEMVGPARAEDYAELLDQPERDRARSVTMARTFENMLFEGIAWWQITELNPLTLFPSKIVRLDPRSVEVDEARNSVTVNGRPISNDRLIRFDSPTDGLLKAGARAIRTCLTLDAAASRYADGAPPLDYFRPADGMPAPFMDDSEAAEFLNAWLDARQTRSTALIPSNLTYEVAGWNPEQLQLADARQHAVLEIARVAGVDAEELGVSTTSRTYANIFDRRKTFIDFTLGQYRQAFEDRLSMNDVTPRGNSVRLNLSSFLRSDDLTRMQTYEIGLRVGAYDAERIADLEDLQSPITPSRPQGEIVPTADQSPTARFADDDVAIRLDAPHDGAAFAVDVESRTIRGLAVPYGVEAISGGKRWQFAQGTLQFSDPTRVKLWIGHDKDRAVGFATELDDRADGLYATFSIAPGPDGDHALAMAAHGTWDGLSVGLKPGGKYRTQAGVNHAVTAPLMEISLTPSPSYDDARVHAVAAHLTESEIMENETPEIAPVTGPDFSALSGQITDAISAGFAGLTAPQGRESVNPATASFEVAEAPLYRFDGIPGTNSLTGDMRSALSGDSEARGRLHEFFAETFAVTNANVAANNPTENRPDLYVGNLQYTRPLWDSVSNGTITDRTPFTVPKFATATGLVAPHVEGVEPTPGAFTTTAQTVTPGAVSGKIEINREVLDQGGSPQADSIIWQEMLNGYYEAIEARIASKLAAVPTAEVNLAGAVDSALVTQVTDIFTGLQFARGGNRFTGFVLDGQLFPKLVSAKDSSGRPLLPVVNAMNSNGTVTGGFDQVQIGSQVGRAAWALGSGNSAKSYLFVPSSVWAWASAPQRFDFQYQVKSVDVAIWGYGAETVLRDSDVRPIDYTTSDV